jgi:hypothetical protein
MSDSLDLAQDADASSSRSSKKSGKGGKSATAQKVQNPKGGRTGSNKKAGGAEVEEVAKGKPFEEALEVSCSNGARIVGNGWRSHKKLKPIMREMCIAEFYEFWSIVVKVMGDRSTVKSKDAAQAADILFSRESGTNYFGNWDEVAAKEVSQEKKKKEKEKRKAAAADKEKGGKDKSKSAKKAKPSSD